MIFIELLFLLVKIYFLKIDEKIFMIYIIPYINDLFQIFQIFLLDLLFFF